MFFGSFPPMFRYDVHSRGAVRSLPEQGIKDKTLLSIVRALAKSNNNFLEVHSQTKPRVRVCVCAHGSQAQASSPGVKRHASAVAAATDTPSSS